MVLVSLDENEIREIRKTLENILLKDMTKKDQLVHLFSKWFRNKGVSPESSQKILNPFAKNLMNMKKQWVQIAFTPYKATTIFLSIEISLKKN